MREFKVRFREQGKEKTAHVYARTYNQAKKMVMNLMYIGEKAIIK